MVIQKRINRHSGFGTALLIVTALAATGAPIDSVFAAPPQPTFDQNVCECVCRLSVSGNNTVLSSYRNPGSCGFLNNHTCSSEVVQQGVHVIRTGTLEGCGPRINIPSARVRLDRLLRGMQSR